MFGGNGVIIEPFMAALEMIHTYSLVHDDLPAMDDDDYRRGRLTTHKKYDEATAILAGDALLNYAYETVTLAAQQVQSEDELRRVCKAMTILSRKAGIYGMVGGQTADMQAEKKGNAVIKQEVLYIHENKTAALIQSALTIGACLAGASQDDINRMEEIGRLVGISFQIQDDILDMVGDAQILGKPTGSDAKNEKVTYVTLVGLEQAVEDQKHLSEQAVELLHGLSVRNEFLETLLISLITRER